MIGYAAKALPPVYLELPRQFAVYSLFHVEPKRHAWVRMFFQATHPPAPFRQLAGAAGLDTTAIDSGMLPVAQVAVLTAMSLTLALEVFEAVTGTPRLHEDGLEYARFAAVQGPLVQMLLNRHRQLHLDETLQAEGPGRE